MGEDFGTKEWLMVGATLLGPILAVQAQKFVEALNARRNRKERIFRSLMTTRAARFSAEHVQALNLISLVFYGWRPLGIFRWQTASEIAVVRAWDEYLDNLNQNVQDATHEQIERWSERNEILLTELLYAMSLDVGYSFDKVMLRRGSYLPIAHGKWEQQQVDLRAAALEVFKEGLHNATRGAV